MIDEDALVAWLERQVQAGSRHRLAYRRLLSMIKNDLFSHEWEPNEFHTEEA